MRYRVIFIFLLGLLPVRFLWAAPAQQAFSDWQVTCNNQNFCVARNTGEHHGPVMTLSRSAGAHTDAVLRIELGDWTPRCQRGRDCAASAARRCTIIADRRALEHYATASDD